MRLLDLFCGAGGCAKGYQRAGFYVVGVDIKPQKHYCGDEFVQADALEYCAEHGREYDAIHASPPCQRYSRLTGTAYKDSHPALIGPTRDALRLTGRPFVIENVSDARRLLVNPIMLCGTMFGLPIWRHRYFECAPAFYPLLPPCDHSIVPVLISGTPRRNGRRDEPTVAERREAMDVPWMMTQEIDQAIPPAYTEYIGGWLMKEMA